MISKRIIFPFLDRINVQRSDLMRKKIIGNTIIFVVMIGLIIGFSLIFGSENTLIMDFSLLSTSKFLPTEKWRCAKH